MSDSGDAALTCFVYACMYVHLLFVVVRLICCSSLSDSNLTCRYVEEDAWNAQHIEMLVRAGVLVRSKVAGKRRVKMLDFLD